MLIKEFLEMLMPNDEGGVYCAVVASEEYSLPMSRFYNKNGENGTFFQGVSSDIPEELMRKKFTKWDMLGNILIFICQ